MDRMMLNEYLWSKIEPLLPGKESDCGVTAKDNWLFLEAVLWINRIGSPCSGLPECFEHWHRVYVRYNRWVHKGILQRVLEALALWRISSLFISIARVHQHGAARKTSAKNKDKGVRAAA